jgi:phosphoribosylamine--glycine ligase/phosphoribosylformylglycinamidine cyclo-ligase
MAIRILLLGSGGREHALAWKLSQSDLLDHLYVCPGNGGTSQELKSSNLDISISDFPRLVEFALKNEVKTKWRFCWEDDLSIFTQINLVVPGPEQPLVDGIESHFRKGVAHVLPVVYT